MSSEVATKANRPEGKKTTKTLRYQALGRKGGAGKTTVTSNLTEMWGRMGLKTLAVDMDANASLTKRMGVRLSDLRASIYDLLMSPASLIKTADVILKPEHLSFDLLPGSENLSYAEPSLLMARKQRVLADRLAEVENDYDVVMIDTAGHESFLHTLVHVYADKVILPLEADTDHWEALNTTLASVERVRSEGLNPNIRPISIFVIRYRGRTRFGDALINKLQNEYGDLFFPMVTMESIRAKEAGAMGLPIVSYDPDGQSALAFKKYAEHLING